MLVAATRVTLASAIRSKGTNDLPGSGDVPQWQRYMQLHVMPHVNTDSGLAKLAGLSLWSSKLYI